MIFTWLNKQGVRSDAGFEVQRTGRFAAEYRQDGKVVTLRCESGLIGEQPCIILDPDAFIRWDDDHPASQISSAQQQCMFNNFRQAVEFQGLQMVIEATEPVPRGARII